MQLSLAKDMANGVSFKQKQRNSFGLRQPTCRCLHHLPRLQSHHQTSWRWIFNSTPLSTPIIWRSFTAFIDEQQKQNNAKTAQEKEPTSDPVCMPVIKGLLSITYLFTSFFFTHKFFKQFLLSKDKKHEDIFTLIRQTSALALFRSSWHKRKIGFKRTFCRWDTEWHQNKARDK